MSSGSHFISGSGGIGRARQPQQQQVQSASVVLAAQPEQYIPTETTNNLFSTSYGKILDLIGEGEVEGLVGGLQGISLNGTPIQNPDGSLNFDGVSVETRNGTQPQGYIPGFDEVASETGVGVVVTASAPVVRTITAPSDAVRVTVALPALQQYTDKGDILGASVNLQIAVQHNGGGYSVVIDDTISGRTSQQYERQYRVALSGPFPINIRVSRVTPDSTSSKLANAFSWTSYSSIIYAKLRYPNSALVALRFNAEQFSSVPSRAYRMRLLKVKIPSNATVDSSNGRLIYSGVWNGALGAAQWTSDPAWCLWALLTNNRWGFGDHIDPSNLDKFAFYSASQYASALVPDGFGGLEPRFSCNVYIQTADEAYRLINDLCSVMRCMPYQSEGALTISQDRPTDAQFLFTLANVVGPDFFTYSSSSIKSRPTVAVVRFQNLNLGGEGDYEVVEDAEGIARYGIVTAEIVAFACTSRGQACRLGKWLLHEENRGETVTFTSNLAAGAVVRPGMLIQIADPLRAGARRGGLIASALPAVDVSLLDELSDILDIDGITRVSSQPASAIVLDDATGLTMANAPTLSVMLSDGSMQARPVASIAGNVVRVAPPFSTLPELNSVWMFETSNIQASLWRVLSVGENDGVKYPITALAHNASKYDHVERGLALTERDITDLNIAPDAPSNLTGTEVLYEAGSRALAKLQIGWSMVPGASGYRISYREALGNWRIQTASSNSFDIFDTRESSYEILVSSVGIGLLTSKPAKLLVATYGKTAPPAGVSGASLIPIDQASAILSWTLAPDLDVRLGGRVLIRHSPRLDTPTWGEAVSIIPAASGNQTQKQVPLLEGSYLLKFEDDGGRQSPGVAYVVTDLPQPQTRLLVRRYAEDQESPPFNGNGIDMFYSPYFDALVLGSGALISSHPSIAALPSIAGGDTSLTQPVVARGEYEFGSTYSFGGVFDVNIRRRFVTRTLNQIDLIASRPGLLSSWSSVAGADSGDVDAALLVRTTLGDPDAAPQWSDWHELANGIVRGWGFQFKVVARSYDLAQNIIIDELGADLELQQRIEQSGTVSATAGAYAVTFAERFYDVPNIGVTAYSMNAGDYWVINPASITRSGFSVTFRDADGAAVARHFNYTAIGFGREVT
jgi:hypothetical protein